MSLSTRLILSYILIIVLCLSIVAASLFVALKDNLDRLAVARLADMALPIYVQTRALARGQVTLTQLWTNLEEQAQESGIYIFVLDSQGNVIKEATPTGSSSPYPPKLPPRNLPSERLRPFLGTYITPDGERFIFVAHPLIGLFKPPQPLRYPRNPGSGHAAQESPSRLG